MSSIIIRKIYGVGICDIKGESRTPCYKAWIRMLQRCYKLNLGAKVCNQWLTYSNFKIWHEETTNSIRATGYLGELELDKDLNCQDGLIYSPQDCSLLPREINRLLVNIGHSIVNSTGFAGVDKDNRGNLKKPYRTSHYHNSKKVHIYFKSKEEAYIVRLTLLVKRINALLELHADLLNAQNRYASLARLSSIETLRQYEELDAMIKEVTLC